jgi:hypothetical protein
MKMHLEMIKSSVVPQKGFVRAWDHGEAVRSLNSVVVVLIKNKKGCKIS